MIQSYKSLVAATKTEEESQSFLSWHVSEIRQRSEWEEGVERRETGWGDRPTTAEAIKFLAFFLWESLFAEKVFFKGQKQAFKNKLTSLGCWTPTPLTYDSVQKYVLWSLFMMEKGLLGLFLKCRLDHCKVSVENSGGKCRRWNSWGPTSLVNGNEPSTLKIGIVIVIVSVWLLQKSLFTAFLIWSLFITNRANSPKVGKTFMTMMSRWTGEH